MKKLLGLLAGIVLSTPLLGQEVMHRGMARNVMMGTDLSPQVQLDSLLKRPHLYALGPVDDLQGELMVLDGRAWASVVVKGKQELRDASQLHAPFLVYSYVPAWTEIKLAVPIESADMLERLLATYAQAHGIREGTAFPFRITGVFDEVKYHVIMRNKKEKQHSHEAHNKAKQHFLETEVAGELLGFFSTQHEGVFTHKGKKTHVHFMNSAGNGLGHVDGLLAPSGMRLWLPVMAY